MTTSRRAARAATLPLPDDGRPPRELRDPDAAVWHDRAKFLKYMARHGWGNALPPQERLGGSSSAGNRRSAAAESWGAAHGLTNGQAADWHRLRSLGLID